MLPSANKPFQVSVTLAILISTLLPLNSRADDKLRTVLDLAQDVQDFYPAGSAKAGVGDLDYYVMSGLSTSKAPTIRGAVLINIMTSPGERLQIVEISSINCEARSLRPTFRLTLDSKGRIQNASPTSAAEVEAGTLLTPNAANLTMDLLCKGEIPSNTLRNRSLSDFR